MTTGDYSNAELNWMRSACDADRNERPFILLDSLEADGARVRYAGRQVRYEILGKLGFSFKSIRSADK